MKTDATPDAQLRSLIAKFDAKDQKLIRAVRSAVRKRLPAANELAYDYGTFFVIAYSPTDHPTDGIVSIAARPDGVRLYFMQGPRLPDPKKLLTGTGKQVRFIRVETASRLAHPDVEALIAATIDQASVPLPATGRGKLVIKTFAGKSLSRRRPAKQARGLTKKERSMRLVPLFVALMLLPATCRAGGTLEFAQVDQLLQQKPAIRAVLLQSLVMPDSAFAEVRLGSHFTRLGGYRLGPYIFEASPREGAGAPVQVTLCTSFQFLDGSGKVIPEDSDQQYSAPQVREVLDAVVLRDIGDVRAAVCP